MKNKNNSLFSISLYIDALKQLRLIGFISFGIISAISVIIMAGKTMDDKYYRSTLRIVTTLAACIPMYLIFMLCVPIMTLFLFSFLTKRSASDYFHSLPQKRGCLYNTYFLAIATWNFIITFGTAIVIGVAYGIEKSYFVFSFMNLIRFSFAVFLSGLLVEVSILIACAITGTIFTNICVAGLILFLPRLIMMLMARMITSNLEILVQSKILPLFDYNYNPIFGSIMTLFGSEEMIYDIGGLVYTFVIVIIYFIAGHYLFVERKSETAGNPSANRALQCIIRVGLAIPVCMLSIRYIFRTLINDKISLNSQDWFSVFVFYLIAIAVMLLYELISTKKIKYVVRAIPSIGILAILNILLMLSMYGIYVSQLNYKPEVGDISYITVSNTKNIKTDDYFEKAISSKKISSTELKTFMSEMLKKNIGYEKTSYPQERNNLSKTAYSNDKTTDNSSKKGAYVTVGFKTGITMKYRKLYLDSAEYEEYLNILFASEDIKDFYIDLPEYDKNLMTIHVLDFIDDGISAEESEEIYEILREEAKGMDYNSWFNLVYDQYPMIGLIWSYNINDIETRTYLLSSLDMPKTFLKYMNLMNGSDAEAKLDDVMGLIFDNTDAVYRVDVSAYKPDSMNFTDIHINNKSSLQNPLETVKKLNSIIDRKSFGKIDSLERTDMVLVRMDVSVDYNITGAESDYKANSKNCTIFTYVDKQIFEEIVSLNK